MKKLVFFFAFVLSAGLVTAQDAQAKKSCSKTCMKTCLEKSMKSASVDTDETQVASAEKAAEIAAASDESIERKVCSDTGAISYYKKETCAHSGAVKMTEVNFDAESNSFVNVSPRDVMAAEKEAKVVKTSAKSKKECSKACAKTCKGKKAGA